MKKVTSISLRRYRSTALKESILSNSDIFDTSFSMSTFMRACLQSLCCSCSAAARLCRNQGMKLGPSRNLLLKMRNISHASSICQQLMKKPSKFLHEKKGPAYLYRSNQLDLILLDKNFPGPLAAKPLTNSSA